MNLRARQVGADKKIFHSESVQPPFSSEPVPVHSNQALTGISYQCPQDFPSYVYISQALSLQ